MRTILRLAHRLWINFEPYLALAPLKSLPVWGLAVSALTAFWTWIVSTIQAIHGLGWGVWLVLGLALTLLTLFALLLAIWVRDRWRERRQRHGLVDAESVSGLDPKGGANLASSSTAPLSADEQLNEEVSRQQAEIRRDVRKAERRIKRGIGAIYK